jgi:hypothetical protein
MTAGRYKGATAGKAVPFPSVVRWSCFSASHTAAARELGFSGLTQVVVNLAWE